MTDDDPVRPAADEPALDDAGPAESPTDDAPPPAKQALSSRWTAREGLDRYMPIVAVGVMIVTYLQIGPYFGLTFIGAVWLLATRVTRSHKFLGLTLTEGLAWAATSLIFLFVILLFLGAASAPA
jgi:hypothetical protein